jgi:ElaB/YqjD/DUF883 family membrane-anchored ribosome-binding protein
MTTAQKKDVNDESPLREELAQLRADIDSLVGTVGRLADGAASSLVNSAKRSVSNAGERVEDVYDAALAEGRRTLKSTERTIRTHPYLSVAIAAGVGVLIGRLLTSRQ